MMVCRICGGPSLASYDVQELLLGTRERFTYLRCGGCGSLQLSQLLAPPELAGFYPPLYHERFRTCSLGGPASRRVVPPGSRVLDVGCGPGLWLWSLYREAFGARREAPPPADQLVGCDPFATPAYGAALAARIPGAPRIVCGTIHELAEPPCSFDVVAWHHSLEHVPDPGAGLAASARLLRPGGTCLVRIPVADCELWTRYGPHWVGLDAPRHLHVLSRRAVIRLAAEVGLACIGMEDDATVFGIAVSELYQRDLSPAELRADPFPPAQIATWMAEVDALNSAGRGDQTMFLFRKAGP